MPRMSARLGASQPTVSAVEITSVKWLGQLCRIELTGAGQGVIADLRGLPADASTSIAESAKETLGTGKVSLIVPDEDHEGEKAHVVLVGPDGQLLAQKEVVVGMNR